VVQRRTMSHTDMGVVGATTDTFILFENGVRRNLSLSETLSGRENDTIGYFQACALKMVVG